jgi:hypothetical protein
MSLLPIHSTSPSGASLVATSASFNSRLWTNLTGISAGRYSMLFKFVGLAVFFLLCNCVYRIYKPKTGTDFSKNPVTPEVVSLSTVKTPVLPNGIEQNQVDELVNMFTQHFKTWEKPQEGPITYNHRDPTERVISPDELETICKGVRPETNAGQQKCAHLFKYLKEQEIIASFEIQRCANYFCKLHDKFIQKLKNPSTS